jgi:hypothetical protein
MTDAVVSGIARIATDVGVRMTDLPVLLPKRL